MPAPTKRSRDLRATNEPLGAEYQYDLMGINQNLYGTGWEIGAYTYVPEDFSATH